jgi:hypothetical protein
MLIKTLQIVWHDKLPVLSCEFHSSGSLVTAGADHEIKARAPDSNQCVHRFEISGKPSSRIVGVVCPASR